MRGFQRQRIGSDWNCILSDNAGTTSSILATALSMLRWAIRGKITLTTAGFPSCKIPSTSQSKSIRDIAHGFHLAFGAEHRFENYQLFAGEEASYKTYTPNIYGVGTDSLFEETTGAFIGFDTISAARRCQVFLKEVSPTGFSLMIPAVIGGYVDAELDVTDKWLIGGAVRLEKITAISGLRTITNSLPLPCDLQF